jgi:hypothetical protein
MLTADQGWGQEPNMTTGTTWWLCRYIPRRARQRSRCNRFSEYLEGEKKILKFTGLPFASYMFDNWSCLDCSGPLGRPGCQSLWNLFLPFRHRRMGKMISALFDVSRLALWYEVQTGLKVVATERQGWCPFPDGCPFPECCCWADFFIDKDFSWRTWVYRLILLSSLSDMVALGNWWCLILRWVR